MDGILSDQSIRAAVESGDIEIDPFVPEHVNVTSYDLTLGNEVRVYSNWVTGTPGDHNRISRLNYGLTEGETSALRDGDFYAQWIQGEHVKRVSWGELDSRVAPKTEAWQFDERGFLLKPDIGYLMHTKERVKTNKFNPVLDGKSSIGRLFIQIHATAGFGDPGFNGQYTLEVLVTHPVRVYPGMRFCQIRFHTIAGELGRTYDQVGHYTRESAVGAVASQAWKQFR